MVERWAGYVSGWNIISRLGSFKCILFFWKSSDKIFCIWIYFLCYYTLLSVAPFIFFCTRLVVKCRNYFQKHFYTLSWDKWKAGRKTDEQILENNKTKTFHFYFPTTGKHHSIGLKDKCWPEDLSYAYRLKFAASDESNKKMLLRFGPGTFETKFFGVTESEDASTRVLTQVENTIDAASRSQIVDLTFSEIQESTPDNFNGQKSISQSASSRHKDIESFFTSKRNRTASIRPAPKALRLESD